MDIIYIYEIRWLIWDKMSKRFCDLWNEIKSLSDQKEDIILNLKIKMLGRFSNFDRLFFNFDRFDCSFKWVKYVTWRWKITLCVLCFKPQQHYKLKLWKLKLWQIILCILIYWLNSVLWTAKNMQACFLFWYRNLRLGFKISAKSIDFSVYLQFHFQLT